MAEHAHRRSLAEGWRLRLLDAGEGAPSDALPDSIPAVVPGCVHTDLLRAGLLGDPDVGTAEREQHWVGRSTWSYTTIVPWHGERGQRSELVCEGLDTLAEVRLNDGALGTTRNMHRTHRFDVTDQLRPGANELEVVFHPIHTEVDRVRAIVGELPATDAVHYPYVRKMACNFGWDWGPTLVTAGIWRPIMLESWSTARLESVRPLATVEGTTGRLEVNARVARVDGDAALTLRATLAGTTASAPIDRDAGQVTLRIPDVTLWWPIGLGDQPLYDLSVELLAGGRVLDATSRRVGFRTVEIDEPPDELGRRWAIVVNGVRVPVRGFNWIPDAPFPSDVAAATYARRIDEAVAANANLLRVWGGGIYESSAFYAHCDERGVLVWQDFLFACAAYPETAEYAGEVEAEAREAVVQRCHHPSLVVWNGNNECIWGYHDWGWQQVLQGRPWGAGYYTETLPAVVAELDPTRPYLPGSPWSGDLEAPPNDDARGVSHIWDVWNERDFVHYRDRAPAFVAEFGFGGPPTWATLRRAVPEGDLTLDNPVVRHHERALDGPAKLERGLAARFPVVADPDDWLLLAQVNQARALTVGIDHLRALERCSGAVVWQLNDCWPVISWAAIDGDGRRKPAWYAVREAFSPRRAVLQPASGGLELVVLNDRTERWRTRVVLRRARFDGSVLSGSSIDVDVPALGTTRVALDAELARAGDPSSEVLLAEAEGRRTTWFWAEDRQLDYPAAAWDVEVAEHAAGLRLRVTARTFVRELAVFPDRLHRDGLPLGPEAVTDDLLLTLLPGETVELIVRGADARHADAVSRRPVLRAVNDVPELVRG